jgi:ATPase subunit of ABC transporter with duplicated ATPase domains
MQQQQDGLALFVRAKKGCLVRRHGTTQHFGVMSTGTGDITWDTETIFAISQTEVTKYGTEYSRAIAEGGLEKTTRAEWEKQREEKKRQKDAVLAFLKRARQKHAEELQAAHPDRKVEELSDEELLAWARSKSIDVTAPAERLQNDHATQNSPAAPAEKGQ